MTGIRTNISGNVLSSSSAPANDDTLTTHQHHPHWHIPVARLIARNTFCQLANTSATPPIRPILKNTTKQRIQRVGLRGCLWGVLSVPSARHCNLDSKFSICAARAADKSRNCERFSYSACFSAMRDVRMCGGRKRAAGCCDAVEEAFVFAMVVAS